MPLEAAQSSPAFYENAVYRQANPGLPGIVWESGAECPKLRTQCPRRKIASVQEEQAQSGKLAGCQKGRATLLFQNSAQLNCQPHPLLRRRLLGDQQRPGFAELRRFTDAVPMALVGRISEMRCLAQNLGFLSSPNHIQLCSWRPWPGHLIH